MSSNPDEIQSPGRFFLIFIRDSIPMVVMRSFPLLQQFLAYYFISWFKSDNFTAGFGVGNSCYLFFNYLPIIMTSDAASILITQHYGASNHREMRLTYHRGLGANILLTTIALLFFIRLDLLLTPIGFPPEISKTAHTFI
jgi:Na+-driven multidrug efflux pump